MLSSHSCVGIILVAGHAKRIQPLSAFMPKPLLPICNKPIMQYQIEAMRDAGICDLVIVVGQRNGPIESHFLDGSSLGVRLTYVVDDDPQGIASSLALAEPFVRDRCLVFLGDIFLQLRDLAGAMKTLDDTGADSLLFVKRESDPEAIKRNFAVEVDAAGQVTQVVEKPKVLHNDLKGCGVYAFDRSVFEAIRKTPRSPLRNEYELTDAIQVLIDMGTHVRVAESVRFDVNVTFPTDLLACNLFWLREQGLEQLCGTDVYLSPGTTLDEAVLGDSVRVDKPTLIRQSVILPHTQVEAASGVIERCIMMPGMQLAL